jgi:hypothetical protein
MKEFEGRTVTDYKNEKSRKCGNQKKERHEHVNVTERTSVRSDLNNKHVSVICRLEPIPRLVLKTLEKFQTLRNMYTILLTDPKFQHLSGVNSFACSR